MKVIFFHIPKTAGSSLVRGLHNALFDFKNPFKRFHFSICPRASLEADVNETFQNRCMIAKYAMRLNNISLVTGHFPYFDIPDVVDEKSEWIRLSVLRDPVKRFLSEYYYNTHKSSDHLKIDVSLDDYLSSDRAKLSGSTYLKWFSSECNMEEAKENIQKLDVLGFQENLNELANNLNSSYGMRVKLKQINKRPKASKSLLEENITDVQLAKIKELCEKDMNLYDYFARN